MGKPGGDLGTGEDRLGEEALADLGGGERVGVFLEDWVGIGGIAEGLGHGWLGRPWCRQIMDVVNGGVG